MQYVFGSVCVNRAARSVSGPGGTVHVTTKAFDLLLLLLDSRSSVVSKEQIHDRLWPGTFVTESSIQTLIHEIRHAIDVPGDARSWIRTVRGIGYCFEGDVAVSDPAAAVRIDHPAAWLVGDSIRVALHAGENIVGRAGHGVLEIDAPTISRRHARITIGDAMWLDDLGSKNGTWLDGERVLDRRSFADGATVRLGFATFTFRLARPPKSTESVDDVPASGAVETARGPTRDSTVEGPDGSDDRRENGSG
jgi:DNA-binding winged helix-turn-helix (wHTH) protein